jgi:hypothetical protein
MTEFLAVLISEASRRNDEACRQLPRGEVADRKSLLLERDFRDLLEHGVLLGGCMAVVDLSDLDMNHGLDKHRELTVLTHNVWDRHFMLFQRAHAVDFGAEMDDVIQEWIDISNNWEGDLKDASITIHPMSTESTGFFRCLQELVTLYVFDNPWIVMKDALGALENMEIERVMNNHVRTILIKVCVDIETLPVAEKVTAELMLPLVKGRQKVSEVEHTDLHLVAKPFEVALPPQAQVDPLVHIEPVTEADVSVFEPPGFDREQIQRDKERMMVQATMEELAYHAEGEFTLCKLEDPQLGLTEHPVAIPVPLRSSPPYLLGLEAHKVF